jgi:uncharacterized protein YkwD
MNSTMLHGSKCYRHRGYRRLKGTNRATSLCFAGAITLTLAGCALPPESRAVHAPSATALAKARLDPAAAISKLNACRAEKGLRPLRLDPALTAMAERQALAMAASGTMSHDVAGSFSARLTASGINAVARGKSRRGLHELRRGPGRLAHLGRP